MDAIQADKHSAEEPREPRRSGGEPGRAERLRDGGAVAPEHPDYYRRLLESAGEPMLVLGRDARIRYASPAALRLSGCHPRELLGMYPRAFLHPAELPLLVEGFSSCIAEGGSVVEARFRLRRKDGSWVEAEAALRNLLGDPAVGGIVVSLRETGVPGGRQGEPGASEEGYRFLVENLHEVVFSLDARGYVLYISPAVERISRYLAGDLTGRPFTRFIHPDDLQVFLQGFHRALAGEGEPCEFRMLDKDGEHFYVQCSSRPFGENGRPHGLVGVMSEISERKRLDEARKRSGEHFRAMIRRNINYSRGSQA